MVHKSCDKMHLIHWTMQIKKQTLVLPETSTDTLSLYSSGNVASGTTAQQGNEGIVKHYMQDNYTAT